MKRTKLSEFCDLKNGYAFKSKDYISESNTLLCRMSNIRPDGTFNIEYNKKCVPDEFCEIYKEYLLEDGDLIVAMTDMANDPKILGVPTIVDTNGYNVLLNQRVGKLIIKKQDLIDKRYLKYALSVPSLKSYYKKFAGGGLQINIGKKEILNIEIPIPSLTVQRKIVSTLQKTQEIIDKRKAQIEALDQLTQSVFLEMFGDPIINNKKFHVIKGKDLFTLSSGKFISSNEKSKDGKYPIYGGNGINGYCDSYLIDIKTIVIGRVGVYCGNVHLTEPSSWITDNAIYIKDLKKEYNLTFLYYLFRNMNFNRFADYSGQPKITQKPLYELDYMAPDMELQKLFADKVKRIEHQKELLKSGLIELENMYNVLMQKAFNGELFTKEKVSNL